MLQFIWPFTSEKYDNFHRIIQEFGEHQSKVIHLLEILDLAKSLRDRGCHRIESKFADVSDWNKLLSAFSELRFADEFLKKGFSVSLIPDNDPPEWPGDKRSPDLEIKKDNQKFYVEVVKLSRYDTSSKIGELINSILKENKDKPFVVTVHYSRSFAIPVIESKKKTEREQQINEFISKFKKILLSVDESSLPQEREIMGCIVNFSKSPQKYGYYRGASSEAFINPEAKYNQYIADYLKKKANKRNSFNKSQKGIPYLIAIDTDDNLILPPLIPQQLFGSIGSTARPPLEKPSVSLPYSEPEIVTQAKEKGWRSLLEEVGFKPSMQEYINHNGFLLNEPEAKNITGVIFRVGGKFQLIPNPFASPEINFPDLSKIIQLPLGIDF